MSDTDTLRGRYKKNATFVAVFFVECKTTTWRPGETFNLSFSLTVITNEPLELGI
jgi:hypothetical protein